MVLEIAFGRRTRVAMDINCGIASFGTYLMDCNVSTLSIATKDGILLLEVNRMLRAGGYFICAAEPVAPFKEMEDLTQRLSWELLKEGDISIWRKPLNNSCYLSRAPAVQPSLCDAGDDPDNVWNVNLKKCITQLPENGYGANMTAWPARLHSPPNRLFSIKMDAELSRREIFKESRAETSSEPAPPPNKSAVPVNKTNFPCYFYFNGYCNKGERCSYLHGPDDGTTTWKSSKIASGVPDGLTAEKKTSAGSETGPSAVEKHPDSSETGPKAAACEYVKSKVDLHLTTNNVGEQIASHETSGSPSEEATAVRLDSLVPAECFSQGESDLSPNQSSDEEVEDNVEREDLLESSPGFDVLVDDRVEGLGHEDDHQYMPHHDMEDRELDERFAGYDFENSLEYDPSYPDMRIASDQEQDGSYYNVENHEINEHVREIPIPAHGRQNVPHKRRLSREMPFRGRGNVDLRDLLKRRRGNESDPPNHLSRRFDLSRSNAREQSRNRYCRPQGSPWMPQRLASKVESNVSFSSGFVESAEHLKKLRQSQGSSYRQQHFKDRRRGRSRPFAKEPPRRMPYRERLTEAPKIFNAPKTLAQIREEKGRGREDGDSFERTAPSGVIEREDFSGPIP